MRKLSVRQRGFSLLEVLVAVGIFTIITGAVFSLLNIAQQRYKMEQDYMDSFQGARQAMDQITRDIHSAGYPAGNSFLPAVATANPQNVAAPFAWAPGYSVTYPFPAGCTVGGGCSATGGPAQFDLIIEGQIDPALSPSVQWVRYQLQGTTLMRGVAIKTPGSDPVTSTGLVMSPYLDNVMNNTSVAEMNRIQQNYPAMFPGNAPVPIFQYTQDPSPPSGIVASSPFNILEVEITLIVRAANPDPQTGVWRVVTLNGRARRLNPPS